MVAAGVLLLVAGVGAGVVGARWSAARPELEARGAPVTARPGPGSPARLSDFVGALPRPTSGQDTSIPGLLELAHGALDQGRLDEARGLYERVLARAPRNAEAITHLGAVLYQEGRIEDALAKVEEALRIDPTYIHAHWDRTQYLFHGKRDFPATVKAADAFLRVLPAGPDADSVRRLRAEAQARTVKVPDN